MQKSLLTKAFAVTVLALLLLVPLTMISQTISERALRRNVVIDEIARTATGAQTVAGPVLALPYTITRTAVVTVDGQAVKHKIGTDEQTLYYLPAALTVDGSVNPELRHRGLFEVLLYEAGLKLSGTFNLPPNGGLTLKENEELTWGTPYLAVGVSDNRGIRNAPKLTFKGHSHIFKPGNPVTALGNGIHANLSPEVIGGGLFTFDFQLDLQGTSRLGWLPLGEDTRVQLNSSWQHPSFVGSFLPRTRSINDKGFKAEWQTSHFATNMPQRFADAVKANDSSLLNEHVSVNFVQPVDIYQQAERSVKYGFLFVLLTFAAFALFEVLKELRIHPVQYGLVGIALALFFLLLIALSEHMRFALAYALASAACVGLLTFYLCNVLRSIRRGLAFGGLLTLLYGALYGLLVSEDNALLMGSLLLFALLAGAMLLTRKVDWYGLGRTGTGRTVGEHMATLHD